MLQLSAGRKGEDPDSPVLNFGVGDVVRVADGHAAIVGQNQNGSWVIEPMRKAAGTKRSVPEAELGELVVKSISHSSTQQEEILKEIKWSVPEIIEVCKDSRAMKVWLPRMHNRLPLPTSCPLR